MVGECWLALGKVFMWTVTFLQPGLQELRGSVVLKQEVLSLPPAMEDHWRVSDSLDTECPTDPGVG